MQRGGEGGELVSLSGGLRRNLQGLNGYSSLVSRSSELARIMFSSIVVQFAPLLSNLTRIKKEAGVYKGDGGNEGSHRRCRRVWILCIKA
ncbi:hypothetical protein QJS10_CPB15g01108 [Acorus calamus]|uniref:Uncharacterized protein n=1 Tax=Acorus calamus TaxID=4465 RepID=A0AAV9D745_ACOCL|nr:hypothetical protein QJS10_CPB15g01108 [Acorus calamus]